MFDTFQRGTSFNPMRFREEIKSLELSMTRLELLLQQKLSAKIKQEAGYLKNSWRELENKLRGAEKAEAPYYFVREQTKRKIDWLLGEVSKFLCDEQKGSRRRQAGPLQQLQQ